MINRLCLIGVGLIGGSLAMALRERGLVGDITGYARRVETLDTARYLGLIDRGETDLAAALAGADCVVIAIPVGQYRALFTQMQPFWPTQAVVTDCGSTKASAHADLESVFGAVPTNFVAGHPVAGTERSGPAAAVPDLFRHRRVILTPHPRTEAAAVQRIQSIWQTVGATVSLMSDARHDDILARTSHLPHLVAYQLIGTLADTRDAEELFRYAAGGLRDLTRIASSDPAMWRDIVCANREAVGAALDDYIADLQRLRSAVQDNDGALLEQRFEHARNTRDHWIRMAEAD
ncbi:MAG: prephenate dehydrogenase/arogenate dehydrogenase family protein [Oceanococcaceae bacterium]